MSGNSQRAVGFMTDAESFVIACGQKANRKSIVAAQNSVAGEPIFTYDPNTSGVADLFKAPIVALHADDMRCVAQAFHCLAVCVPPLVGIRVHWRHFKEARRFAQR